MSLEAVTLSARHSLLGGPYYGAENELEHQLLAEDFWDDLQPLTLFDEQPIQQVGRANGSTMVDRHLQVRNAGFVVIAEQTTTLGSSDP